MNTKQTYTINIVSEHPPRICLGDVVAGGEVVGITCANDEPDIVSAAWLANRLNISKSTITNKCKCINIGTVGKALYHRDQAIAVLSQKQLSQKQKRRGRPRSN